MRKLMRMNVVKGTGKRADAEGYRVGGKTGTAEKVVKGRYSSSALAHELPRDLPDRRSRNMSCWSCSTSRSASPPPMAMPRPASNAAPTVGKIVARIGPILGVQPKLEDGKRRFDAKVSATY